MRNVLLTIITILLATSAFAQDLGDKRLYESPRAAAPPVIDGKLDDACWKTAPATGQFWKLKSVANEVQPTSFQVCYDEKAVYIGVTCAEANPRAIAANVKIEDDSTVMGDDAIELFLRPDLQGRDYYQFSANSLGTRYDGRGFDAGWNGEWQAAGNTGDKGWTLECAISFKSFGRFAVPGAVWGLQVCRDRQAGEDTEWSAWAPSPGGFHQPDKFGNLIFGGAAGAGDRATLIECARLAQVNLALEERLGRALATVRGHDLTKLPPPQRERIQAQLAAAEEAQQSLRDLLKGTNLLDSRQWYAVNTDLRKAADDLDEVAWLVRFDKLLGDH
jgi:hypothetical protein